MSSILTNVQKSLVIANKLNVSNTILQLNRLDYLLLSQIADMPSKEELITQYEESVLTTMKERDDKHLDPIDLFISADPSNNRKYTVWLIKSYIRGGINKLEDLLSRAKPALEDFILLSKHKKLEQGDKPWENQTDINNYFGLISGEEKGRTKLGLEDIITIHEEFLNSKKGIKQVKETARENLPIVFENDLATVYKPLTEEASCYIGQGTKWCTAARENNMFEHYSKDGPLFVIVPKNPEYQGEKYQYHHESSQYMNEKDEAVDPIELFERFNILHEIQNIKLVKTKSLRYSLNILNKYKDIRLFITINSIDDLEHYNKYSNNILGLSLDLDINYIPDLSNFNKLQILYVNLKITKIENLEALTNLIELNLTDNEITKIENLDKLTNLKILDLMNNDITKIENLDKLTNLTDLYISNNNITKIEGLETLINLTDLYISNNNITKIEGLETLINLKTINLRNNSITKIEGLDKLTNLDRIYLIGNEIDEKEIPDRYKDIVRM